MVVAARPGWLTAELEALLQHNVLPCLRLADLAALKRSCRATRELVEASSIGVYWAAACNSKLPLSHPVFGETTVAAVQQRCDEAANIHEAIVTGRGHWKEQCARPLVTACTSWECLRRILCAAGRKACPCGKKQAVHSVPTGGWHAMRPWR